jgi:hypothetical protein
MSVGVKSNVATASQKKHAMSILVGGRCCPTNIARRLPMEAAPAQKAKRGVELVRFVASSLRNVVSSSLTFVVYLFTGHKQTLKSAMSAGALIFAATNLQKKLATIFLPTNCIAARLPMEVALAQKARRSAELVRFFNYTLRGRSARPLRVYGLPFFLWTRSRPEEQLYRMVH